MAGVWSMVVPQLTEYTNLCANPSFETNTTGWTAVSGSADTTVLSTHGYSSMLVAPSATACGVYYGPVALLTGETYTAGIDINSVGSNKAYKIFFADTSGTQVGTETSFTVASSTYWERHYVSLVCATSDNYRLYIQKTDDDILAFRIDGVSIVSTTAELTYFDGDTANCRWTGAAHGSTSVASAQARNIGVVTDLQDYNLRVLTMDGVNTTPSTHHVTPYAMMPGAEYNGHKVQPRYITLTNATYGTSLENLHSKRKDIVDLFKHDLTADDQPFILRYTGANASRPVDINCYLAQEIGQFDQQKVQRNAIQLVSYDPYFYDLTDSVYSLSPNGNGTYGYFIAKHNGAWSNIASATADTPGTGVRVRDILIQGSHIIKSSPFGPRSQSTTNERVYVSGYFLNWGGGADNDYIALYNPALGTWSTLQAGTNGYVRSMDIAPDGKLYACGEFTQIGSATADRIAYWGGASWDVMGTGFDGIAYDVLVGNDGKVYACGNDTTIGGVADAAYVAYWDGANWQKMATGLDGVAYVLTKDNAGNIYIGGTQTGYVSKWDGSAFTNLALPKICWALKSTPSGKLYAGVYSATADNIYEYNGQAWTALGAVDAGTGGASYIYSIDIDADGMVWIGGDFTTAGDLTVQGLVCWNGYSFVHPGVQLPASSVVYKVLCNGNNVYIGYDQPGTVYYSTPTNVTNNGTARNYPVIKITRSGGTSSQLRNITNETTGAALYFDYNLQDGETVYIDLREGRRAVTSSYYGDIWRAVLRGSNFGDFYLIPGVNSIDVFCYNVGSPTLNAYILHQGRHESIDGAAA